ncbi:MAG TPA: trypsin-like peptidase domain-containing protein [Patescibacteria group bacterium]|nr:trypsin-like peptidase domain-containing protein [Patescibacteria group bacterium]
MSSKLKIITGLLALVLVAGPASAFLIISDKLEKQKRAVETRLGIAEKQIAILQEQLALTGSATQALEKAQTRAAGGNFEDQLTNTVASATPGVVSIVISKDVPQLEVVYVNPFGDDPFFSDIPMRVPVYRQKGTTKQKVGGGSGFFVTSSGYIVTNRHVVEDTTASYTVLMQNGKTAEAKVTYRDPVNDLAIIKIQGNGHPALSLGNSDDLKLGQSVIAIGNALAEYNNSVSRGIISGLNRDITAGGARGSEKLSGVIQTDAAINPGNSGGPLLTLDGAVVGVNVATVSGTNNISFSIPINQVKKLLQSLK